MLACNLQLVNWTYAAIVAMDSECLLEHGPLSPGVY